MLRNRLQQGIENLPGVRINGDLENRLDGHLHISIDDANTQTLLMKLDMAGIAASAGSACASGSLARSHVIEAMGIARENQADIRFSIGANNTVEEIDKSIQVICRLLMK